MKRFVDQLIKSIPTTELYPIESDKKVKIAEERLRTMGYRIIKKQQVRQNPNNKPVYDILLEKI
jgi:hypothetical protein